MYSWRWYRSMQMDDELKRGGTLVHILILEPFSLAHMSSHKPQMNGVIIVSAWASSHHPLPFPSSGLN